MVLISVNTVLRLLKRSTCVRAEHTWQLSLSAGLRPSQSAIVARNANSACVCVCVRSVNVCYWICLHLNLVSRFMLQSANR